MPVVPRQRGGLVSTAERVACQQMPNRGSRLARDPLQISETVSDPFIYLVRHSRSANCGRGSTPAATAKDTERAGVRARRYGKPYRNTERNSGAGQHFRDHQMPNRWSRCMRCCHCPMRWACRRCSHLIYRSINRSSILSIFMLCPRPAGRSPCSARSRPCSGAGSVRAASGPAFRARTHASRGVVQRSG
jgi:hypothetical protein